MRIEQIRLYQDREDVTLTTYLLDDSTEMLNGKKRPGVLVCPGGGYFYCADREAEPVAIKFASMGYHAFVLRYSTRDGMKSAMQDSDTPILRETQSLHPTPVLEIGRAMLIIREHEEEWLVNADQIAVCGFSAGGHNAAMYAATWHTDLFRDHFHEKTDRFRPAAAILGYAVTDYAAGNEDETGMDMASANRNLLGTEHPSRELLESVSPVKLVTEQMPPTFLWSTAGDTIVPPQQSIAMAYALAEKKVPFEIHVFERGEHGLALATQATSGSAGPAWDVDPDNARWADLAGRWLEKHMALPLLPGKRV